MSIVIILIVCVLSLHVIWRRRWQDFHSDYNFLPYRIHVSEVGSSFKFQIGTNFKFTLIGKIWQQRPKNRSSYRKYCRLRYIWVYASIELKYVASIRFEWIIFRIPPAYLYWSVAQSFLLIQKGVFARASYASVRMFPMLSILGNDVFLHFPRFYTLFFLKRTR